MTIIFLSAANSIHTVRWVNSLSNKGLKVHLVSLPNHRETEKDPILDSVEVHYLPYSGFKGYFLNFFALRKIKKKIKPDVINVHYASGYGTLAMLSKIKPYLLNVWGSDVYDFPQKNILFHLLVVHNLKKAHTLASTSHIMANKTRLLLKNDKDIKITPFGVDIDLFKNESKNKDRSNYNISLCIIKTLKEKYGIKYLVQSFDIAQKKILTDLNINIKLNIYGEGEQFDELNKLVLNLGLSKHIFFKGYVSNFDVPHILNESDIFCLSSIENSESFGVSAVEAMACGLPVIATDADGFTEVVNNNETGFIVPKKNIELFADRIYDLVKDKDLRLKMGDAGRKRVEQLYDWDSNVNMMIDIYHKMKA